MKPGAFYTAATREAIVGGGPADPDPTADLGGWLLRPYLDLSPSEHGPLHAAGVDLAYAELLGAGDRLPPFQLHPPGALRRLAAAQTGLAAFAVSRPADLPAPWRTDRWDQLEDRCRRAPAVDDEGLLRLAVLLNALALYGATVEVVPPCDDGIDTSPVVAQLAVKRSYAQWKAAPSEAEAARDAFVLARVAASPAALPRTRLMAALTLLVRHARGANPDVAAARLWRERATAEYERLTPEDEALDAVYGSVFWRAVSFVPFHEGDAESTTRELDRAEHLARSVPGGPGTAPATRIVRDQNLHPLLETRTREALWRGDADLALARAGALAAHDPLDPKVHLGLGDLLRRLGRPDDALASYRTAAALGPPYGPKAWFMVGQCLEEGGDADGAVEAYVAALAVDPGGLSAARRLAELTRHHQRGIAGWSAAVLDDLERRAARR